MQLDVYFVHCVRRQLPNATMLLIICELTHVQLLLEFKFLSCSLGK